MNDSVKGSPFSDGIRSGGQKLATVVRTSDTFACDFGTTAMAQDNLSSNQLVRHERRVVGHASGWQEQMDTCVCGRKWPCLLDRLRADRDISDHSANNGWRRVKAPKNETDAADEIERLSQDLARTESARAAILAENTHYKQRAAELTQPWEQLIKQTLSDEGIDTGVFMTRLCRKVEDQKRELARLHKERATPEPPVARLRSEWHEDDGPVLWWRFPISEPPYCGSPLDDDWSQHEYEGYYTHWTPIPVPHSGASVTKPAGN